MIRIGNRRSRDQGEYVGRPTVLGNVYPMEDESDRDEVCEEYAHNFAKLVTEQHPSVMAELFRLQAILREKGELTLVCWCAPKRCHAETIKAWLEANP